MIIRSRIRERGINALMIVLLLLATGIYSCVQARSLQHYQRALPGQTFSDQRDRGMGLEYQLPVEYDFVHLFAGAKYGVPLSSATDRAHFKNTSIKNFTSISIGISFGRLR